MKLFTIRIPDDLAIRLKKNACTQGISVNKLLTEISIRALQTYDPESDIHKKP